MEAEVDELKQCSGKLTLIWIPYRLDCKIKINHLDSASKKNPVMPKANVSSKVMFSDFTYHALRQLFLSRRKTKHHICAALTKTMTMIQKLQKQDLEL
ncbi:spindle and kinetochore-associated protein 2-like [Sorex araneus]|uniref:spindle and kinetochore-associated protein 2-like n=1 Tax=Sorex araneus TaxID=42254 RepID=UPI0024336F7E|nr:spindle and kinetochore-associated protein 2-like [Sorex araneus]